MEPGPAGVSSETHPHDITWTVLSTETIYESPWVSLDRCDVAMPDGTVIRGHHLVRFPRPAVGVVAVSSDDRFLMVEHHRFTNDSRGWELVCGRLEPGETAVEAARRELMEEAGVEAEGFEEGTTFYPASGTCRLQFATVVARGARLAGAPTGRQETGPPRWFTRDEILAMMRRGEINQGLSLTALLWHFQLGGV